MAITRTQLNQSQSTTNQQPYDTGTITPGANSLVLIGISFQHTTTGTPTITVTSNAGLTMSTAWSVIKRVDYNTIAAPTRGEAIIGAIAGASPGSGSVHIVFNITESGLIWEVIELDGVDLSGGTVASCIVQTGSGSSDTAGTTWTDTLTSAANTNNAVFAVGGNANKNAPGGTWNQGFTKVVDAGSTESTAYNMGDGYVLSGFTGSSHTVTSTTASAVWGICGAEIKAQALNLTEPDDEYRLRFFAPTFTGRLFRDEGWAPVQPPFETQDRPWFWQTFPARATGRIFTDDSMAPQTPPPPVMAQDRAWIPPTFARSYTGRLFVEDSKAPPPPVRQDRPFTPPTFPRVATGRVFVEDSLSPTPPAAGFVAEDRGWVSPTFPSRFTGRLFVEDSLPPTPPAAGLVAQDRPWTAPTFPRLATGRLFVDDGFMVVQIPRVDDPRLLYRAFRAIGASSVRLDDGSIIFQAVAALVAADERFPNAIRAAAYAALSARGIFDDGTLAFPTTPPPPGLILYFRYDP